MVQSKNSLENIFKSKSKIAIVRLFFNRTNNFKATGRAIAKQIDVSAPAAHAALKELFSLGILKLDIIGKQHIYCLDANNRMVLKVLKPLFKKELSLKEEIKEYLIGQINKKKIKNKIVSLILYGSMVRGESKIQSDVDIAVIVKKKSDKKEIEGKFLDVISVEFNKYFKIHLDAYIKTKNEFRLRLKKNLPPVSTLLESYFVIWGKEPLEV